MLDLLENNLLIYRKKAKMSQRHVVEAVNDSYRYLQRGKVISEGRFRLVERKRRGYSPWICLFISRILGYQMEDVFPSQYVIFKRMVDGSSSHKREEDRQA